MRGDSKYDNAIKAIVFSKCKGVNDITTPGVPKLNPETGETFLVDCLNVTTTIDGAIQKIPEIVTKYTHTLPIVNVSAGNRLLFSDSVSTHEIVGNSAVTRFPLIVGPIINTPIDVRITDVSNYRSRNNAPTYEIASIGVNPDPQTTKPLYAMPVYKNGFVYNSRLYVVNNADSRFLQYSRPYHYDLFALGDDYIAVTEPILQAKHIYSQKPDKNGCVILLHESSVTVLDGSGPEDFTNNSYICKPLVGSLYSGWVDKDSEYFHIFLADDGVYVVSDEGVITCVTKGTFENVSGLNNTYYGATMDNGKYIAYGNNITVEYDMNTKSVMKRSTNQIVSATELNNSSYFAQGRNICSYGPNMDSILPASITFPYSDFGNRGAKSISDLYITGAFTGDIVITATGNTGVYWEKEVPELGECFGKQIQVPRIVIGNKISLKIESFSGEFRLEELKALCVPSNRSK